MEPLPQSVKSLFIQFLQDAAIEHTRKGSKMALVYNRALDKVNKHDQDITEPRQLKKIPFIGEKTAQYLCNKLQAYCREHDYQTPESFIVPSGAIGAEKRRSEVDDPSKNPTKKQRKKPNYLPRRRAGSWAILIALYIRDKQRRGLRKDEITTTAAPYCDASFNNNPSGSSFYSAWDGIKVLVTREYVNVSGSTPKLYSLTDSGIALAKVIIDQEGIESSPVRQENPETSFDNGLRVTPDNTLSSSHGSRNDPSIRYSQTNAPGPYNAMLSSPLKKFGHKITSGALDSSDISLIESSPHKIIHSKNATHQHKTNKNIVQNIPTNDFDKSGTQREFIDLESSPIRDHGMVENGVPSAGLPVNVSDLLKPSNQVTSKPQHDRANKIYSGIHYDIWGPSDYEIIPIIDNREIRSSKERDFFETMLSNNNVKCEVRALSLGDIVWIAKHKTTGREVVLDYVCERKRMDDLAASIKDGRFQEQKSRLKKSGMRYVFYLVEEISGDNKTTEMIKAIETAISMTMTVTKFYVRRSKNIDSTIAYLASVTKVIQEKYIGGNKNLIVLKPRAIESQEEFSSQLGLFRDKFEMGRHNYACVHLFPLFQDAMPKTGMMTVKEMFILMLMTAKGVSMEKAMVVQRHFQTPKNLIEFFIQNQHLEESEKKTLMTNLFKNEVGNKKISKIASDNIYSAWGK